MILAFSAGMLIAEFIAANLSLRMARRSPLSPVNLPVKIILLAIRSSAVPSPDTEWWALFGRLSDRVGLCSLGPKSALMIQLSFISNFIGSLYGNRIVDSLRYYRILNDTRTLVTVCRRPLGVYSGLLQNAHFTAKSTDRETISSFNSTQ